MIVSGTKHACATCIRGHRSSSCTHADRPLFEIRKKGRPVSQCPHCRDLRKIKSCHTRCECGETSAEQSKSSKCKCHSGQPCSCAGPVQVYQYIPTEQSRSASTTTSASNSSRDGPKTPGENIGSMLHMFQSATTVNNMASPQSANQIKTQHAMPYPTAQLHRENSIQPAISPSYDLEAFMSSDSGMQQFSNDLMQYSAQSSLHPALGLQESMTPSLDQSSRPVARPISAPRSRQHTQYGSSSISRSTRSIGVNTDPLPAGLWPEDLFTVPGFMRQSTTGASPALHTEVPYHDVAEAKEPAKSNHSCPKFKDMPLKDLGIDRYNLTDSTTPVPSFSAFYGPRGDPASALTSGQGMMALDSFADEDEFDPEEWDQLFDVPGCALPGIQCKCGEGCSCVGCQTHTHNTENIALAELERMDFRAETKAREHPAGCCDTRVLHMQPQHSTAESTGLAYTSSQETCCSKNG